jgi:N-acetylmuramoyl-L-alanine amidase
MPLRVLLVIFSILWVLSSHGQEHSVVQVRRVVIDPGHGGSSPGAVSPDGRVREKDITLSVSLKLGEMIKSKYPHIEVIYTRTRDISVPLDRRSEIANKNKADLFISIHVNAAESRYAQGSETFVMGPDKSGSNFEVTMLENSVIMLEGDDYATRYEGFNPNNPESYIIFSLLQNAHLEQSLIMASLVQKHFTNGPIKVNRGVKQGPFLVLWKTTMPSVLIELGFISNSSDLRILNDKNNHTRFASLIFKAFEEYKLQYDKDYYNGVIGIEGAIENRDKIIAEDTTSAIQEKSTVHYRIQILSLNKIIPVGSADFKGRRDVSYIKSGSLYKYTVGEYQSQAHAREALERVRRDFPQAFIIKVERGEIVPINR